MTKGRTHSREELHDMARRSFAIPSTVLIAGAIGFAAGGYLAPNDEANEFRDLERSSIGGGAGNDQPSRGHPDLDGVGI